MSGVALQPNLPMESVFAAGELSRSEVSPSFVIMDSQNNPFAEAILGWCYASSQTLLMAQLAYAKKLPVVFAARTSRRCSLLWLRGLWRFKWALLKWSLKSHFHWKLNSEIHPKVTRIFQTVSQVCAQQIKTKLRQIQNLIWCARQWQPLLLNQSARFDKVR